MATTTTAEALEISQLQKRLDDLTNAAEANEREGNRALNAAVQCRAQADVVRRLITHVRNGGLS